ncbi:hypothetical protein PULV_b0008 [Pseudoalteromonas ulvae UL12]|nr:hypothetical protein [Pseudoalteromonas ulvae UL12]
MVCLPAYFGDKLIKAQPSLNEQPPLFAYVKDLYKLVGIEHIIG